LTALIQWIRDSLEAAGVRIAELAPAIAIDAGHIPRTSLADPLDRLLVATARRLEATFLTSDERILQYASKTGGLRVHDARLSAPGTGYRRGTASINSASAFLKLAPPAVAPR
jgi:hypothetical protein